MSWRVLVAGGGIAGLEALLTLQRLAPQAVEPTLLDPAAEFVNKPLLVVEPFGTGEAGRLDLTEAAADVGATHVRSGLAAVDLGTRRVTTTDGQALEFDGLLVAIGARPVEAIPGAVTFGDQDGRNRFAEILEALGRRGMRRVAFVVPPAAQWSIAAYELALLTAAERDVRNLSDIELTVVTHEREPLAPLGGHASAVVRARLDGARIALRIGVRALEFARPELRLEDGAAVPADAVVALPRLEVPPIAGLPQGEGGFLDTDREMRVVGAPRVWAAGDIVAGSIKQGGLAAQQADVAARAIAAAAGAPVPVEPFRPVLRAALLTGGVPEFFRSAGGADDAATTGYPLWTTPGAKVASGSVAPFLAETLGGLETATPDPLEDRPAPADAGEGRDALRLLLAAAEHDAEAGDPERALAWLHVVELLDLAIPTEYVTKRDEWRRRLDPARAVDPAAGRIDPSLRGMDHALSDLERRVGWLRHMEARGAADMGARLREFDRGLDQLRALTRKTGILR